MQRFDIGGEVNVQRLTMTPAPGSSSVAFIDTLRIGGRPVPLEMYEAIPEEPLCGTPLWRVNHHWGGCASLPASSHVHVLWLNPEGELRRTTVSREPPPGHDPAVWQSRFQQLRKLPQIFVGD
jgi:hypothetical protein